MNSDYNQKFKKKYLKYKNKYLSYKNQLGGNKSIRVINAGTNELICELDIDQDFKIKDLIDRIAQENLPDLVEVKFVNKQDINGEYLYNDDNQKVYDLEETTFYVFLYKLKQAEKQKITTVISQEVDGDLSNKRYSDSDLQLYKKPYPNEKIDIENKPIVGNRAEFKDTGNESDGIRGTIIKKYEDSHNYTRFIMKCDDGKIIDGFSYKFSLIIKLP